MIGFEWLKNGNFIFTWGCEQYKHTIYPSPYSCGVLHKYKKILKDVFVQYGDRYLRSNILFIDEGQHNLEDNSKDICLKIPLFWTFYGSHGR